MRREREGEGRETGRIKEETIADEGRRSAERNTFRRNSLPGFLGHLIITSSNSFEQVLGNRVVEWRSPRQSACNH